MSKQFSIKTSASEYVTGICEGTVSTVASVRLALRMDETQARSVLRTIKARYDNGAEMFENPTEVRS